MASAGYGSRRHCEELIREGRVTIDNQLVDRLAVTVEPAVQTVRVDGVVLRKQKLVYYAVHKPAGVVTTNSDPQGRPRVIDLVPPEPRVFPVGRLDRNSDGLILLTNDGDLTQMLAHPRFGVQKIYRVTVAGRVDAEAMKKMRQGMYIAEGHVRVDGARVLKAKSKVTEMEIRLREGKNREIRRILARLGHKVLQLRRIAIGSLRLGDMPPAAYRVLTREEVRKLQETVQTATQKAPAEDSPPKPRSKRSGTSKPRAGSKKGTAKPRAGSKGEPQSGSQAGQKSRAGKGAAKRASRATRPSDLPPKANVGTIIGADPPAESSASETPTSGRPNRRSGKRVSKRSGEGKTGSGTKHRASGRSRNTKRSRRRP